MTNKEPICAGLHITAKPIGPRCNLSCRYCFYSEKAALYPGEADWHMSEELLERFISEYIAATPGREVPFLWQGGEPMLMGLDFYRTVTFLQAKYAHGKRISNAIQTNGTLLDEPWCRFLKNEGFLVGLSLDGPADVHNAHRVTGSGRPSHDAVLQGMDLLKRFGVDFNVLCCVTASSAGQGGRIYRYLRDRGVGFIQFAPVVERLPNESAAAFGLHNAEPAPGSGCLAPFSVKAEDYGAFLCDVFDEWVRRDVGAVFVMNFEWALESWMGLPGTYCVFAERCGKALALEHNGDVYACDHFVYPDYRLGNLRDMSCAALLETPAAAAFRKKKKDLPPCCMDCEFLFACNGECPKNRILPGGENILCAGYRRYFSHIRPSMEKLVALLKSGRPAQEIMDV